METFSASLALCEGNSPGELWGSSHKILEPNNRVITGAQISIYGYFIHPLIGVMCYNLDTGKGMRNRKKNKHNVVPIK